MVTAESGKILWNIVKMKQSMTQCRNWGDMMYLSRITLNTALRETMKALVSPNLFHGAIECSFDGARARRLWRIDDLNGKKYILLVSEAVPDLKQFAEQFGYAGEYEPDFGGWKMAVSVDGESCGFKNEREDHGAHHA